MPHRADLRSGVLAEWNDERGFGFIEPADSGARVFAHISGFTGSERRPRAGDRVAYALGPGRDGRPRATRVSIVEPLARTPRAPRPPRPSQVDRMPRADRRGRVMPLMFLPVAGFALLLVLAIAWWGASPWFAVLYTGMSAVAFGMYAWDKRAAIDGARRTRESTLQAAALLGGWPGAVVAQQLLRHKNRKTSFQLAFWLIVVVNVGAFVVLTWRPALIEQLTDALG
ncbi:DUF1294 domain-containing protein [Gryllotalpicola ginsengisoli]|uniref:DUF1294 domain-containing protein n=1 Tax=Gryllotalpicola ginsengisoli TaxID=444608 RepID=UPI0003B41708|nr:cold shock and DUF1294 domain-containing protein [Gryllotalpicola ginsengisoli]